MSSADPKLHRSYLYAPGSSPRVMRKAFTAGADAVILDLEDAVAPAAKDDARDAIAAFLAERVAGQDGNGAASGDGAISRPDVHVRINRSGEGYLDADLQAVVVPGLDAIRLPKAETPAAIGTVDATLDELERSRDLARGHIRLYLTVESAIGALSIGSLIAASSRIARVVLGTADLLADLGASGDDDLATLHVRSDLVLRSRAAGVGPPIDGVFTDLEDLGGLRRAAEWARSLGFYGKSVLHPRQLDTVHAVFTPTEEQFAHAERIVAALEEAEREGRGAVSLDGEFIDAAIVARARAVLSLRS